MRTRRGFTLLETVMAAALGGLVLAGALSMFAMIERSQRAVFMRAESNQESARVHRTMQRTFSTLLVLESVPAAPTPPAPTTQAEDDNDPDALIDAPVEVPPQPRLLLEADPRYPGMGIQRLEVVLAAAPIPADPTRAAEFAWAAEIIALDAPVQQLGQGLGVRGAFVLMENQRTNEDTIEPGWSLWWVPADGQRVQVAKGLRRFRWMLARTDETGLQQHEEYAATTAMDLPAYAQVEFETIAGSYSNMMFEIAWSTTTLETEEGLTTGGNGGDVGDGAGGDDAGGGRGNNADGGANQRRPQGRAPGRTPRPAGRDGGNAGGGGRGGGGDDR